MLLPIYRSAVRQFDARVQAVRDEQWSLSTPDTEWDVHRLVRHVIVGQTTMTAALIGGASERIGQDLSGPELVTRWTAASTAAVEALTAASPDSQVQLPTGAAPVSELGWRLATDLTVHAWDLARAIDAPDEFPNDLLAHVLDQLKGSDGRWLPPDRYAPSIPVPGCTDDLTELLALTGRNRWWRRNATAFAPSSSA